MPLCACVALMATLFSAEIAPIPPPAPPALTLRGNVSQYAPGLMSVVVSNRLAWGHVDALRGLPIAVEDCRLLGRGGVATFDDFGAHRVTVVDCLASHHDDQLFRDGVIFEVGHAAAARFDFVGRGGVWADLVIDG